MQHLQIDDAAGVKNLYNNVYKGIKHKKEGGYMEKVIEVKNLYKLYRVGDEVVRALDGVDFNIYKGEFCAIVGTSGSGKSTLLNMLAGLEKPTKGEVIISGEHIEKKNEDFAAEVAAQMNA